MSDHWWSAAVSGGIGAALATVAAAVIQAVSRKGEARATAAELLTNAASGLVDRLNKLNSDQETDLVELRDAVHSLIGCVEELMEYAPVEKRPAVRDTIRKARAAL